MGQRIVLAVILACILTSCEKKPGGQTVAVVNNEEITAGDLNAELTNANVSASDAPKEVRAQALDRLIDRRLLAQQAKADGIDKSPEFLSRERRATEELLISMLLSRQTNTQQVPSATEIAKYEASRPGMFANRETWTLQQLTYPVPKDASVKSKITAAKTLDEIAQVLTAAGIQFSRSTKQLDSAMLPPNLYAQLSHLGPGEPFVVPTTDKEIASVITAREPAPLNPDQQRQLALMQMKQDQINQVIGQRVKELKAKAKIQYQSGFGPPKS